MKKKIVTFCLLYSINSFAGDTLVILYEDLEIKNFKYEEIAYEEIELIDPEFTFSGYLIIEIDTNIFIHQENTKFKFPFYAVYYNQIDKLNADSNRYHLITIDDIAERSTSDFMKGIRNNFINFLYYNTLYNKYYREYYGENMSRLYPFDKNVKLNFKEEQRLWKSDIDPSKYYYAASIILFGPVFRFIDDGYTFMIPTTGRSTVQTIDTTEVEKYGFNKTSRFLKIELE